MIILNEPVIKFKHYRITKIDYKVFEDVEDLEIYETESGTLNATTALNKERDSARLIVKTLIVDKEQRRMANIEITGYFAVDPELKEEKVRSFIRINGTAILFPYVRSIVSFITSMDNENAILLPTINTQGFGSNYEESE
ncbi:protein-export chaperone SecB [Lactococcus lactis]|nr:protein-export chaperone SecB [Lactococcus lactis]